jgi:phosphoadenosine phosphosulfate reductase
MNKERIDTLNIRLHDLSAEEILHHVLKEFGDSITFASSLGAEDQVITHMIAQINKETSIFMLDTGRLFPETYDLLEKTNLRYKINIKVFFPNAQQVEEMVNEKGINLFYKSIENRKLCCHIRKTIPLQRALEGKKAWITGLRKQQAVTRTDLDKVVWDDVNGLIKVNPLIEWSENDIWDYIKKHNIPYNPLHDKGYPSIGCQPCTRAIFPGEDIRAGRWWWENPETKECGLHKA